MKKYLIPACFGLILPLALVSCGGNVSSGYSKNTTLGEEPVTLQLCGSTASFSALPKAAVEFQKIYPNVSINCEYVQNYADSMAARLANTTPSVDLFINNGVKREAETKNSVIIASI
jgi:ABC-type phosphate transport system substrate-binding protein